MKPRLTPRKIIYGFFHYFMQWGAGILAAVFSYAATMDSGKWKDVWWVKDFINFNKDYRFVAFLLTMSFVVGKFASQKMGAPWAWESMQKTLTHWKKAVFPGLSDDEHRITLFKHTWKWSSLYSLSGFRALRSQPQITLFRPSTWPDGWFKPVARSGKVAQKDIRWFPCFDRKGDEGGVIGIIWRESEGKNVDELPDLDREAVTDKDFQTYTERTKVSEKWLRDGKGRKNPCSFCGIRIELDGGHLWGVVIIDSRREEIGVKGSELSLAAVTLGEFIKRA
jgi:hypothetical protein